MVGTKSSATVQQMQPLASSMTSSSLAHGVAAAFQNLAVDADIAEFVDDERDAAATGILQQVADEGGLSGAKEAGDHGGRDFLLVHDVCASGA